MVACGGYRYVRHGYGIIPALEYTMTESRRLRFSTTLKSKVALASLHENACVARLAQSHRLQASQATSRKRQCLEDVRPIIERRISPPVRSPADLVRLANMGELLRRKEVMEGRQQQLRLAG